MCVLAIDIGGTGTKMACAKMQDGHLDLHNVRIFASNEFDSLEDIIKLYLDEADHQCVRASIAIAGPVTSDICKLTNLSWTISKKGLESTFDFDDIYLLNDLEAQGFAITQPQSIETQVIAANPNADGNYAIVAPGTGLGEAFVCKSGDRYLPFPSEGGHCDFSPTNNTEMELLEFVKSKHKRVSWERIISGSMGFINIYEFFIETQRFQWDRELDEAKRQDASYFARELFRLAHNDLLIAKETINLYCELLGAESGNLVLKVMATGGLYLSGGVTRHLLPFIDQSRFYERFIAKGRFKELLRGVPITAILDKHIGIKGAAIKALYEN